jgi:hypothetical protein
MTVMPQCANCTVAYCQRVPLEIIQKDTLPEFCPMKTSEETIKKVIERYGKDDVKRIYVPATITEKEAYECVRGVRIARASRATSPIERYSCLRLFGRERMQKKAMKEEQGLLKETGYSDKAIKYNAIYFWIRQTSKFVENTTFGCLFRIFIGLAFQRAQLCWAFLTRQH